MRTNKCRTVAKIFMGITVLSFFIIVVEIVLCSIPADWDWNLPFDMKWDYVMLTLGNSLILLVVTLWLFWGSRTPKDWEERADDLEDLLDEEDFSACVTVPYTTQQQLAIRSKATAPKTAQTKDTKIKNAAKIILPIVGACAVGIAIAVILKRRKK